MRKFLGLGIVLILSAASALGQGIDCKPNCKAGFSPRSFSIPLGIIYGAIRAPVCMAQPETCPGLIAEIAAGFLIPSIKVTLGGTVTADGWVECKEGCCPGKDLYAQPHVMLSGTTTVEGIPPAQASVVTSVSGPLIWDQSPDDINPVRCIIAPEKQEIPISSCTVSLVFLDNFAVPVYEGGTVGEARVAVEATECVVSYGCASREESPPENRPPQLTAGFEFKVPVGRATPLPLAAWDPDGDPVRIWISPQSWEGASIYFDELQDCYVINIRENYTGPESVGCPVYAYDLRPGVDVRPGEEPKEGQYFHEVIGWIYLVIVRNHPPQAISDGMTISPEGKTAGPVKYAATDPDLPDNHGYQLYFVPLGMPAWDCGSAIDMYWHPFTPGLPGQYTEGEYGLQFTCR